MRARPIFWLLLAAAPIGGCDSGGQTPVVGHVDKKATPSAPSAAQAPNNAVERGGAYVYSAFNRRDPFRSYLLDVKDREQAERDKEPQSETQMYETSQYRLSAIISGSSLPSAMVEDPSGRGHVLHIGDRIGKSNGRITNIDATGVSIVETFHDSSGKSLEVPSVMRLPQSDEHDFVAK